MEPLKNREKQILAYMKEEIRKAPTERTVKFDELWGGKVKAC